MLTAVGMRQRYLLGKKNFDSYQKLLENGDFFVQSTDFYRTIQSAYAEIYGAFHHELENMKKEGRGLFKLNQK